jgi:hypothetical protein
MKLQVMFKTPDVIDVMMEQAISGVARESDLTEEGLQQIKEEINRTISRYVQYNEYITIEFDTSNKTARVVTTREI